MAATERIPNLLEDDLLDAEVGEFLQNYLQLSGEVCSRKGMFSFRLIKNIQIRIIVQLLTMTEFTYFGKTFELSSYI